MDLGLLEEFRFDWELAGKAARTVDDYIAALRLLFAGSPEPDLGAAKAWMASTSYASVRRKRAQAIRAFGRWGEGTGEVVFPWWKEVPLVGEEQRPGEKFPRGSGAVSRGGGSQTRAASRRVWLVEGNLVPALDRS